MNTSLVLFDGTMLHPPARHPWDLQQHGGTRAKGTVDGVIYAPKSALVGTVPVSWETVNESERGRDQDRD